MEEKCNNKKKKKWKKKKFQLCQRKAAVITELLQNLSWFRLFLVTLQEKCCSKPIDWIGFVLSDWSDAHCQILWFPQQAFKSVSHYD